MNNQAYENFMNQDFSDLANWIYTLNGYEFTLVATIIAFLIAPTLTINQQNSLGNFFEQIGQTMLTIAAQQQTIKHKRKQNTSLSSDKITNLEEEIYRLKAEVVQLRKDSLMNDNV